jgi:hypothetical protein
MENDHVLSGLIRKRAEIAGQLEAAQNALRMLIIDLDNLDAAIRIFDPDIDLAEIRPKPLPPRNHAFKGEVSRIVLGMLRTADRRLVKVIGKRVGAVLRHHRQTGTVRSLDGDGQLLLWEVAR